MAFGLMPPGMLLLVSTIRVSQVTNTRTASLFTWMLARSSSCRPAGLFAARSGSWKKPRLVSTATFGLLADVLLNQEYMIGGALGPVTWLGAQTKENFCSITRPAVLSVWCSV